jgi:hypothetical protein
MHIVALHRATDETPSLDERPVAVASAERGCGEDVNIWSSVRRQRRCAVSLAAEDADRSPVRPTLRHESTSLVCPLDLSQRKIKLPRTSSHSLHTAYMSASGLSDSF